MESKPLPPSPPASASTRSSPDLPSPGSPQASELTPPKSPQQVKQNTSSSPMLIGSSPLPPLPAEVFQLIIEHVPALQRHRLRRVCKTWRNFLDAEPSFWSYLRAYTHLYDPQTANLWTRLASVNGEGKPGGGLETLEIHHMAMVQQGTGRLVDVISDAALKARMSHLMDAAEQACLSTCPPLDDDEKSPDGGPHSTLRRMSVYAHPSTVATAWMLHILAENCHRPLFNSLRSVRVYANISDLVLDQAFLSMWPSLQRMNIEGTAGIQGSQKVLSRSRWLWQPPIARGAVAGPISHLPNLQRIDWRRLNVGPDLHMPVMNNLQSLTLATVEWEGRSLYRLLRYARHTLVNLELDDVCLLETQGDEWNDWLLNVNIRDKDMVDGEPPVLQDDVIVLDSETPDVPAPIILHALRTLIVRGEATPPFWTSLEWVDQGDSEIPYPTPQLVMPVLTHFLLDEVVTDQDAIADEIDAPLPALGRNAPNITHFELVHSSASDRSVFQCMAALNACIKSLILAHSEVSDHLLMELVPLTPRLSYLDTRGCHLVSIQTVARFVQRLREEGNPRMSCVFVEPPTNQSTLDDHRAYWWLDFVGLLGREEHDLDGPGPRNLQARRQWKRQGKMSQEAWMRKHWEAEIEKERAAAAQLEAIRLANGLAALGGTSGSSSGASSGSSSLSGSRFPSQLSMMMMPGAGAGHVNGGWPAMYLRGQQQGYVGSDAFQGAFAPANRLHNQAVAHQTTPKPASPTPPSPRAEREREPTAAPMVVENVSAHDGE